MRFIKGWIVLSIVAIIICFPIYLFMDSAKNIAEKISLEDYLELLMPSAISAFSQGASKDAAISISTPIIKAIKKNDNLKYLGMEEREDINNKYTFAIGFDTKPRNVGTSTILIKTADKEFFNAKSAKLISISFIFPDGEIINHPMQVAEVLYKIVYGGS